MTESKREGDTSLDYGANLTRKQFLLVILALALGTMMEWYDFFVYSMLNSILTQAFFPSNNPTVQQVSFWGVFFVGFVARPIGSVIFGHIGDTRGRRLTLLLSIVFMAVPTVLIGCLPTYAQVGVAAPVLLALLRLVQGLAMGGEFGSALVYLHEIACKKRQGFTGSIGFASAMFGCMLGVLVVLILELVLTPAQMLLFGWRLPFLACLVSASAALVLRMHMPEPHEFLQEKQLMNKFHNDLSAVASSISTSTRTFSLSPRHSSIDIEHGAGEHTGSMSHKPAAGHSTQLAAASPASPADIAAAMDCKHSQPRGPDKQQQQQPLQQELESEAPTSGCCALPVVLLLRWYWAGVLLQFLFEAWVSCSFWTLTTWLPNQMSSSLGLSVPVVRGMLIVNFLVLMATQLTAGYASDKGLPRLWSSISVFVIAGAICGPVLLFGMRPHDLTSAWLLHALLVAPVGWVLGIVPATCSPIYPASVRTTGFNLAHNMAMSWLGGLSPTIVTALTAVTGNKFMAPTVLLVAAAAVSTLAGMILWGSAICCQSPLSSKQAVSRSASSVRLVMSVLGYVLKQTMVVALGKCKMFTVLVINVLRGHKESVKRANAHGWHWLRHSAVLDVYYHL